MEDMLKYTQNSPENNAENNIENNVKNNAKNIAFTDDKRSDTWGTLLAMLSGLLFILLFSSWTSPIFHGSYGYDSAFFSMVGRAINNGKVMYRDYFDVKGPVFFFWEAVGQRFFTDRPGIFFLQCICIIGTTYYLYKLCRLYKLSAQKIVFVFFIFYFVFATTLWGGNSVEEYCLPLNMACMYKGIRFLKGYDDRLDVALLYGLTFGICLLSKITVAAPMAAVMLVIFITLIINKRYGDIMKCALLFIAGVLVIAVPVFVYYYLNGALDDMILCSFKVAFDRGTDYYEGFSLKWELYLTACYAGLICFISRVKEKGIEKWLLLSLTVVIFAALHLGTPFDYYFTTTLPLLAFIGILMSCDIADIYELAVPTDDHSMSYETFVDTKTDAAQAVSETIAESAEAESDTVQAVSDAIVQISDLKVSIDSKSGAAEAKSDTVQVVSETIAELAEAKSDTVQAASDAIVQISDLSVETITQAAEAKTDAAQASSDAKRKQLRSLLRRILIAMLGIMAVCGAYFQKTIDKVKENHNIAVNESEMGFYNDCKEVYHIIPEAEREDLFCIESGMIFYEVNQILPKSKYPVNMPYFCQLYPPAEDEIVDILDNHTPKWLVAEDIDEVDNENIKAAVYRHYEMIMDNSMDSLWRRID